MNSNSYLSYILTLGKKDLCILSVIFPPFVSAVFLNLYLLYNSNFWSYPFFLQFGQHKHQAFHIFKLFSSLNFISKEKCDYFALKVFLRCFSLKPVYCQIVPYPIIPVPYCYAFTLLTVGYLSFQFQSLSFPCILNFISFLSSCLCIFVFLLFVPSHDTFEFTLEVCSTV